MSDQNVRTGLWPKLGTVFLYYALLAAVIVFFGTLQRSGIISTAWFLFVLCWIVLAGCGIIVGLLRIFKVFTNKGSTLYIFLAIANFGDSIVGIILYRHPDPTSNSAVIWLYFGMTFCLAGLMLIDIFWRS